VIRNAILHILNEQPMLADLFEAPGPADVGLRCTNLRMMNGKRPVFVDHVNSIFFFPYLNIRFVEIPPASQGGEDGQVTMTGGAAAEAADEAPTAEAEPELEIDEDFLRRIREV
jgi:hypothetical protein